jgi:hypothetical protein
VPLPVRVPAIVTGEVEIVVTFDAGPLAGKLVTRQTVPILGDRQ